MINKTILVVLTATVILTTLIVSSSTGFTASAITTGTLSQSAATPPTFIVFINGSNIQAKNGTSGVIQYSSTDASTTINNVISALPKNGGLIFIKDGNYIINSPILVNNYTMLQGSGYATIFNLGNGKNKDIIKSANFDKLNGTGGGGVGVHSVVIRDLVIDGNNAQNTAGYGIKKYGVQWTINNIVVRNSASGGIYSNGKNSNLVQDSIIDSLTDVRVHHNGGTGIKWDGPNDAQLSNISIYLNQGNVGFMIRSSIQITDSHIWANGIGYCACDDSNKNGTGIKLVSLVGKSVVMISNTEAETEYRGIVVGNNAKLIGNNLWTFFDNIGIQLNGTGNQIQGNFDHNGIGVSIQSNATFLQGSFRANTVSGLQMGSTANIASDNYVVGIFSNNPIDIDWKNVANTNNMITGSIGTNTADETAISNRPSASNQFLLYSYGTGTNIQIPTFQGNINYGANRLRSTDFDIFESGGKALNIQGNNGNLSGVLVIKPTGTATSSTLTLLPTTTGANESLSITSSKDGHTISSNKGSGTLKSLTIRMNGTNEMRFGIDNAINFLNNPISNLKLGNAENASNYRITSLGKPIAPEDATPANVEGLLGYLVVSRCINNQILMYQSINSTWICANNLPSTHFLVGQWDTEMTFTSIGTSFSDVYTTPNSNSHAIQIDTNGYTRIMYQVIWSKPSADTGTQSCSLVDPTNVANVLITTSSLSNGTNTSSDKWIPSSLLNTIHDYKWQCKSTTITDNPSWLGGRVWLKPQ